METNKLKIAIVNSNKQYDDFFKNHFNCELININKTKIIPDIIVFTGGEDIHPMLYNENIGMYTSYNKNRDDLESYIFYKYMKEKSILFIGICRGSQLLTVLNNGRLIQHVEGHSVAKTHSISTFSSGKFNITSTHHQMMYPFNLEENEYHLIAWSTYFRSTTYLNGNNSEIKLHPNFLEPEIVYYPKTNSLAIQGHPEYPICPKNTQQYIINLINSKLK